MWRAADDTRVPVQAFVSFLATETDDPANEQPGVSITYADKYAQHYGVLNGVVKFIAVSVSQSTRCVVAISRRDVPRRELVPRRKRRCARVAFKPAPRLRRCTSSTCIAERVHPSAGVQCVNVLALVVVATGFKALWPNSIASMAATGFRRLLGKRLDSRESGCG